MRHVTALPLYHGTLMINSSRYRKCSLSETGVSRRS